MKEYPRIFLNTLVTIKILMVDARTEEKKRY